MPTLRILAAAALLAVVGCKPEVAPALPAPPKIPVAAVVTRDVPVWLEAIGETAGAVDVAIRARVDGVLDSMAFAEGEPVKKGQLLYTIDPTPFEAKVREADGKLAEAKARFVRAESNLARVRPLVKIDALSKRTLDDAVAEFEASKGVVAAAQASVDNAKIELGYTKITSPIAGLIGISEAKPGEYVGQYPNPVVLNTVSRLDPIKVRFSITEQEYLDAVRRFGPNGPAKKKGEGEGKLDLFLADGSKFPHKGHAELAGREIDPRTGTLTIEALFPNPDKTLRPGQFARIRAALEVKKDSPLVPQRAVVELQGTYQVFVVDGLNKVQVRKVKPGARVGSLWAIDEGIKAGERVVVEALHRVRPGMTVEPVAPQAGAPTP